MQYLFPSQRDTLRPESAAEKGYTHLIAGAKLNAAVMTRLEARIRNEYPVYYERCLALSDRQSVAQSVGA